MEQWKLSIATGIILIILAAMMAFLKKTVNIWTVIIVVLAVIDILSGYVIKKREN